MSVFTEGPMDPVSFKPSTVVAYTMGTRVPLRFDRYGRPYVVKKYSPTPPLTGDPIVIMMVTT